MDMELVSDLFSDVIIQGVYVCVWGGVMYVCAQVHLPMCM